MSLTAAEKEFAKTIRVVDKQKLPEKELVKKHITTINAPAILHETVGDKCLMELSSGNMDWYNKEDVVDI